MLFDQDACGERLRGVVVAHGHRGLQHDGAVIEPRGHQVDGRAGDLHAVLERLPLGIDAGERRQQRGVDVENGVRKRLEKRCSDEPHETGETHERDVTREELARQRTVEGLAARKRPVIDDQCVDAGRARAIEAAGIRAIRDDGGDPRGQPRFIDGVDEGLEIAAST